MPTRRGLLGATPRWRRLVVLADAARSSVLVDALRRVGNVRRFDPAHDPVDALTAEEHCILAELAIGASTEAIGNSIGYSRRSVVRRLGAIPVAARCGLDGGRRQSLAGNHRREQILTSDQGPGRARMNDQERQA